MRVYDILNAGPNNRFMVDGKIVSNCGRLIQVQNLPQNKIPDLSLARALLRSGDHTSFEMLFGNVPMILSQLIRTAFIPKDGHKFYVADFSAIEARMIAWFSGEEWRMNVFRSHGKIYEASAAAAFHVPIETIAKGQVNYALRQRGKVLELACGYGGSVGAVDAMDYSGAIPVDERKGMVDAWRAASPNIVKFWWDVDSAAISAVKNPGQTFKTHKLEFKVTSGILFIKLPSGRSLAYVRPRMEDGKFGKPVITYEGMNQVTKKWTRIDTYGPKLVENGVQAASRDCLADSMVRLDKLGYKIVMHVHDEVIIEAPDTDPDKVLKNICDVMGLPPKWAPDLPLRADGYHCDFYKKD